MVSEEWGNWLLVTPVYPLRRGHDEYPAVAADGAGMTVFRDSLFVQPAPLLNWVVRRWTTYGGHESILVECFTALRLGRRHLPCAYIAGGSVLVDPAFKRRSHSLRCVAELRSDGR